MSVARRLQPPMGAAMLGRGRLPEDAVVAQPDEGFGPTKYDAFISYSHAADAELAKSLQEGLRRLAKPWYGRRALHVFRDATGLSVSPSLWTSICDAWDSSRYFVLMASPTSAASEWVGRELGRWLEQRPADRILIVLTDGEIDWLDAAGDFDWERSTAIHPVLRGAFSEEPLYLDLRWARAEPDLSVRHPRFRGEVAELAAPIHGRHRVPATKRPRSVDGLGFTSDGKSVIAVSAGQQFRGSLVALSADDSSWVRSACAIVNRDLTTSEWNQFVPSASYERTCTTSH